MSKRTMIIAFISLALAFIAYLSFKNDQEVNDNEEPETEEPETEEPETEEPEVKAKKPPKLKTVKDEPIQQETPAAGAEAATATK